MGIPLLDYSSIGSEFLYVMIITPLLDYHNPH